jgi:hypothetical protein
MRKSAGAILFEALRVIRQFIIKAGQWFDVSELFFLDFP